MWANSHWEKSVRKWNIDVYRNKYIINVYQIQTVFYMKTKSQILPSV